MASTGPAEKPPLDRQRVSVEALRLVDEEGLDRLTMRNLATRLGVVPMALYRHVANKEDLVDAVFDLATSTITLPDPGLEWQRGLRVLAHSIRRQLLEHPAIAVGIMSRPTLGPAALDIAEYGYGVMQEGGFSDADTVAGVNTLVTYVLGFTALEIPRQQRESPEPTPELARLESVYTDLPVERYPHTIRLQPPIDSIVTLQQFDDGLDTLLAGLAKKPHNGPSEPDHPPC